MIPFLSEASYSRARSLVSVAVLSALAAGSAVAKDDEGGGWKPRVQQLEAQVAALQLQQLPVEAAVDCASGGRIQQALDANAAGTGLLTITVTGVCSETIRIQRSNVVLRGQGGAVIQAPAGALFIVNVDGNVNNVMISDLTIQGSSTAAVLAHKGARVVLKNALLQQSGSGAMALDNGVLDVTGSTIRSNNNGIYAARGGVVSISNSTVENNSLGVLAFKAGVVNLTSSLPDYSEASVGPVIRSNTTGVVARSGGFVELADTTVQSNQNGVLVDSGSAVHFFSQLNGTGNRITGNGTGVLAIKHASLVFTDNTNVITANVRGIVCSANPSYIVPPNFSGASGNQQGDVISCVP